MADGCVFRATAARVPGLTELANVCHKLGLNSKLAGAFSTMCAWYVLRVRPRYENVAAKELARKGLEQFVPSYTELRNWSDRVKKVELQLFPGYIFCRFELEQRIEVLRTIGVAAIVSFGGLPAPVNEAEMAAIRAIVASEFPALPWRYLRTGDRVTIKHGCLAGISGILISEKGTLRVVANVTILQRSVSVEIDRTMLARDDVVTALGFDA